MRSELLRPPPRAFACPRSGALARCSRSTAGAGRGRAPCSRRWRNSDGHRSLIMSSHYRWIGAARAIGIVPRRSREHLGGPLRQALKSRELRFLLSARRVGRWPPPRASSSPTSAASRKHFIFTDEHDRLRESIGAFVEKELAPHAEEWEERRLPGLGLPAHGRARLPRPLLSRRSTAARAATTTATSCSPRRWRKAQLRRPRDGHRGAHRHGDAADPPVRHRGAEAALPRAGDQGREDLVPRDHRAGRRLGRRRHQDARGARRRRVRDQRLEDLHHERPPRRLHRARDEDRRRTPATTASRCSSSTWTPPA